MAQPDAYTPATSFVGYESQQSWFPGSRFDNEFRAVKTTTDQLRTNLALIQRDDGQLADEIVTMDSLSLTIRALLGDVSTLTLLEQVRVPLSANRTYYVRADGSNSNDGLSDTASGAFLTIQKAINTVGALDLKTFNVTIQVRSGTFLGFQLTGPFVGTGTVTLQGDTTTPSNCVISSGPFAGICCFVTGGANLSIAGFKVTSAAHSGLYAFGPGSKINVTGKMNFGACAVAQVIAGQWASVFGTGNDAHTISGGALAFALANIGHVSISASASRTITVTGTPAFAVGFTYSTRNGVIEISGNTFSGSATGRRYWIDSGGIAFTAGGGASYLPGDTAGVNNGGYYL